MITVFGNARIFTVMALCTVLTACEDHNWRDGFRGRSDQFVYRDINRDDRITRPEWERRYGTVVNDPMIVWFDELDCEGDGVVTWTEYYHNLFLRRDTCPSRPRPFPSGFRDNDLRSGKVLGALTLCEEDSDFQRAMKSHAEVQLTQTQIESIELDCAAPVLGKPPYIGYVTGRCSARESSASAKEQSYFSRVSIRNKNADMTISAITVSVSLSPAGLAEPNGLKHLKTVSVPGGSEQVVTAWFSSHGTEMADAEEESLSNCELHSAMGY